VFEKFNERLINLEDAVLIMNRWCFTKDCTKFILFMLFPSPHRERY